MNNFVGHISEGGRIILCEQVGKVRAEGETYVRRTVDEYIDMAKSAGLCVEKHYLIDFWAHWLFFERRIETNTHTGFRM